MTVYHITNTELHIEALLTLGVSVKSEGSIGRFGTGFKFAIATLLRTGHEVAINGKAFTKVTRTIRGQDFDLIYFDNQPTGFTTQLGRDWQPWMAFRELHSNTLDEGGETTTTCTPATTVISIDGAEYHNVYNKRDEIFLNSSPIFASPQIEVHNRKSSNKFYRGVRAGQWERITLFTYNVLEEMQLTEDRVMPQDWTILNFMACAFAEQCRDAEQIEIALLAPEESFERYMDFGIVSPSELFLDTVFNLRRNPRLNKSALDLLHAQKPETEVIESITLSEIENRDLRRACKLLRKLGVNDDPNHLALTFIEDQDNAVMGYVRKGKIYICRRAFYEGYRRLAGTIYEELLHRDQKYRDCSRAMQNHLLDRLMAFADTEE